jgi:signal transduction histidine kinase
MRSEDFEVFFDRLFPFFLEFGSDLKLLRVGTGFDDRFPSIHGGAELGDVAEIVRPVLDWNFEALRGAKDKLVVVEMLGSSVRFTGQFISLKARDSCFFVGGPWVSSLEVMESSRLKLSDFPPHDPRGDLLLQAQAREAMLGDLAETNRRMQEAREEARVLQEHVERRQRMDVAAQVSGGLAHNFNNLLALMDGHLELAELRVRAGDLAGISQRLAQVRAATGDAAELVKQIQNLSADRAVERQRVDLAEALGRAKHLVQPVLGSDVSWDIQADPVWVTCDPRALQEVLINLAINAAEAMGRTGRITTSVSGNANTEAVALGIPAREERMICLTFADSGPGLPDEVRERVFEPFFSTKDENHSGLGLATVERLITLSGGAVVLAPDQGPGAVFKIFLDAAEE